MTNQKYPFGHELDRVQSLMYIYSHKFPSQRPLNGLKEASCDGANVKEYLVVQLSIGV